MLCIASACDLLGWISSKSPVVPFRLPTVRRIRASEAPFMARLARRSRMLRRVALQQEPCPLLNGRGVMSSNFKHYSVTHRNGVGGGTT
ncbi:hypothetical protein GN956_G8497 [Arapaima gigas]